MTLEETLKQNKEKIRQQRLKKLKRKEMKETVLVTIVALFIIGLTVFTMLNVSVKAKDCEVRYSYARC